LSWDDEIKLAEFIGGLLMQDRIGGGIVLYDQNQNVISYNTHFEALFGQFSNNLLNQNIINLLSGDRFELSQNEIDLLRSGKMMRGYTCLANHINANGEGNTYRIVFDKIEVDGKHQFDLLCFDELLDSQLVNNQFEDYEDQIKELKLFSYLVAHETLSPFRIIEAFGKMLIEEHNSEMTAEMRRIVDIIALRSASGKKLVQDLLFLLKLDNEKAPETNVDLGVVITNVINELEPESHEIKMEVDGKFPVIFGNQMLVNQLFTNLLSNAIKFSKDTRDSAIRVSGALTSNECQITCWDNGIGIDPKYIDQIFEPFFRITNDKVKFGNGLGLAIVKRIVELLDGTIEVDSTEGDFTAFKITFPQSRMR
jgi:signal transduction histidine kinase